MKSFKGKIFIGSLMSFLIVSSVSAYALENQNNSTQEAIQQESQQDEVQQEVGQETTQKKDVEKEEVGQEAVQKEEKVGQEATQKETEELENTKASQKNGWVKENGYYYYYVNGKPLKKQWLELGGYKYYFDYDGRMYCDDEELIYDKETGDYEYYRFDKSGHMITGWYKSKNGWYYYYYDEKGREVEGIREINGATYYLRPQMVQDEFISENGYLYYFGKDGRCEEKAKITKDGWLSLNNEWFYIENRKVLKEQWLRYKGNRYYLDEQGIMYHDCADFIFDEDNHSKYSRYRFNKNGHMMTGWFLKLNGEYEYYDSNGKGADNDLIEINGKKYYFNSLGILIVDRSICFDKKVYIADKNGACTVASNGWYKDLYYMKNGCCVLGWNYIANSWYYFNENTGVMAKDASIKINDKYYYFNNDGKMQRGWIKLSDGNWNYAKPNGQLQCDEWLKDGNTYYYFDGINMTTGTSYVNGVNYLFNKSGKLVGKVDKNKTGWIFNGTSYFYIENGKLICDQFKTVAGKLYYFDKEGVMVTDKEKGDYYFGSKGAAVINTWVKGLGNMYKYYDGSGKVVRNSWKLLNNIWYYFENDIMCTSDCIINNVLNHFRENGAWMNNAQKMTTGWYLVNGEYYYYENGSYVTGFKDIKGKRYYFERYGAMAYSETFGSDYKYYATKNGSIASGWCNNGRYYASKINNRLVDGLTTIDNKKYYFEDYSLSRYDTISEDGSELYIIGSNQAVQQIIKAKGTGWYLAPNKEWYYQYNGKFVTDRWLIGNKFYVFDHNGEMMSNELSYKFGYLQSNGELKTTGWYKYYYLPVYYDHSYDRHEFKKVSGRYYCFVYGRSVDGIYFVDNNDYYYDGNGNRTLVNFKEGWNKFKNNWYYVSNGLVVRDSGDMLYEPFKINDKYYYFGADGKMITNELVYAWNNGYVKKMYLGSNGLPFVSGWKKINGNYYYFNSNGHALKGTHVINSIVYTFDGNGRLL